MPGKPTFSRISAAMGIVCLLICLVAVPSGGQEMRVEEPEIPVTAPIDPAQDAGSWQGGKSSQALSPAQQAALEERRKIVEAMAREIRAKREALENSGQAEKAGIVKELENLILETGGGSRALEQLEKVIEKQSIAQEKNLAKKVEQLEKKLEKAIEKNQDKLDKAEKKEKSKDPK